MVKSRAVIYYNELDNSVIRHTAAKTVLLESLERDNEGYLLDPAEWDEGIALEIAAEINIQLSPEHWAVINFVREFYEAQRVVPETRTVLKHLKEQVNGEKATRRYLYGLFPYGYGQQACKIAGMRKPLKLMLDI